MTITPLQHDDATLAAELVLGLLGLAEEAAARARAATDPVFAADVAAWEERLVPLLGADPVPPPVELWQRVEEAIAPATGQDNRPAGLRLWQGLAALSTAAALVLGVMVVNRPAPMPSATAPALIAVLGAETGGSTVTTNYDPDRGVLTITPVALDTGQLYPELWVIPTGGTARSLGIVTRDRPTQVKVSAELQTLMQRGALLAITPEPAGGAPGGKATGPVIASGTITTI